MVACRFLTWKRSLHGGAAQLVGLADADAALDAAAGQPHREAVGVVVAAGALGVLGRRLPAELAAPDDQRRVEQAALLQVLEQPGDRLVGLAGVLVVVLDQVACGRPSCRRCGRRRSRSG